VALDVPVVGVSTLAAFAVPLVLARKPGVIVSAIDARHGQAYVQACSSTGSMLMGPTVLPLAEVMEHLGQGPFRITGSAAPLLAIAAWSQRHDAEVEGDVVAPSIACVARLGLSADPQAAPPRPLYIKPPDVKLPAGSRLAGVG
jgi:tRNA A37 threonylcarbamoyladenosine modification protein TsaB